MAETSYPFNEDNASGGSKIVGQTQWQQVASMWAPDQVDHSMTSSDTAFKARVVNRSIEIQPGKALVGGFHYHLTSALTVPIAPNSSANYRRDIVVIQVDMSKSAVNIAVVQGTPAATPVPPQPRRVAGGLWEMVLYEVDVAGNDASITFQYRFPCRTPTSVAFPWAGTASGGLKFLPQGSFAVEAAIGDTTPQQEHYKGKDGTLIARDLGKSRTYSPLLLNTAPQGGARTGRWRWIAPNTVFFSARIENDTSKDITPIGDYWILGLTLPVAASNRTGQVVAGFIDNNGSTNSSALPNFVDITGVIYKGSGSGTSNLYLYYPNPKSASGGLDGLKVIPRRGYVNVSGTYEVNN